MYSMTKYGSPLESDPAQCNDAMLGCVSDATACTSRSKRSRARLSEASIGEKTFNATRRLSVFSTARYTFAVELSPSLRTISSLGASSSLTS